MAPLEAWNSEADWDDNSGLYVEQVVVAHKGGDGFGVIAPVQQERQLLGGGIQLDRGLGAKFNFVFRLIAAFDSFHGGFSPS